MLNNIGFYPILGEPLVMWLGIITLLSLLSTALIVFLNRRGIHKIPMKYHFIMAKITIAPAILHGLFGLLDYF